jgi:hypothetical protein
MSIAYSEVFPILAKAVPGFEADEEDWKEPTPYFFLGDMVAFVCERTPSRSNAEASALAALLERLLLEGDSDIRDLVQDGLECVLDCDTREFIAKYFGQKTRELWVQVCQRSAEHSQ